MFGFSVGSIAVRARYFRRFKYSVCLFIFTAISIFCCCLLTVYLLIVLTVDRRSNRRRLRTENGTRASRETFEQIYPLAVVRANAQGENSFE